jgi:hypothetical protein
MHQVVVFRMSFTQANLVGPCPELKHAGGGTLHYLRCCTCALRVHCVAIVSVHVGVLRFYCQEQPPGTMQMCIVVHGVLVEVQAFMTQNRFQL